RGSSQRREERQRERPPSHSPPRDRPRSRHLRALYVPALYDLGSSGGARPALTPSLSIATVLSDSLLTCNKGGDRVRTGRTCNRLHGMNMPPRSSCSRRSTFPSCADHRPLDARQAAAAALADADSGASCARTRSYLKV